MNDGPCSGRFWAMSMDGPATRRRPSTSLDDLTRCCPERDIVSPVNFAIAYAGLGDADLTFQWLEKAYQTRSAGVRELASMCFDSVRSDPRYPDLMNVWAYRSRPAERSARGASRKSTQEAARSMILRRLTLQPRTAS